MSPQFMESFIQNEEGEPSEDFKKEINEHFAKQRGDQPLNVKAESDQCIRYNNIINNTMYDKANDRLLYVATLFTPESV